MVLKLQWHLRFSSLYKRDFDTRLFVFERGRLTRSVVSQVVWFEFSLSCLVTLQWKNSILLIFPHLKEDTLLHQSPHEMSPSLSEYHIATVGNILMVLMMMMMMMISV